MIGSIVAIILITAIIIYIIKRLIQDTDYQTWLNILLVTVILLTVIMSIFMLLNKTDNSSAKNNKPQKTAVHEQTLTKQKDTPKKDLPDNVIPLGDTFNSWLDTACAMKHLDLLISIDCGVLNLAGACGIPTFALFNEYPEFRWFNLRDDVGWYNMKPFQCEKFNEWSPVITKVKKELIQRFNLS